MTSKDEQQAASALSPSLASKLAKSKDGPGIKLGPPVTLERIVEMERTQLQRIRVCLQHEDGSETKVNPLLLGIELVHDFTQDVLVLVNARAVKILGCKPVIRASTMIEDNPDKDRLLRVAAALPAIEAQYRKLPALEQLRETPWNKEAMARCRQYVQQGARMLEEGIGLRIRHPQTGSGKTTLVLATLVALAKQQGCLPEVLFVPELVSMDFGAELGRMVKAAQEADILLLDDIDAGVRGSLTGDIDSSKARQLLLRIVNARYRRHVPTCWTSNAESPDAMLRALGERIVRRVTERSVRLDFGEGACEHVLPSSGNLG